MSELKRTAELTAQAQAALVRWAHRWRAAERAAAEADAAEEGALLGPHDPGPEFARALDAEEAHGDARLAQEEAWAALLRLPAQSMPRELRDYALARGRSEDAWVDAAACLDSMQAMAVGHPEWALGSGPQQARQAWFAAAKAARAAMVLSAVPLREADEQDYHGALDELGAARDALCDACDALPDGGPPPAEARSPPWELKRLRAAAEEATEREMELAARLAGWVEAFLGPPPGRLN
jgi:hypothetical protein